MVSPKQDGQRHTGASAHDYHYYRSTAVASRAWRVTRAYSAPLNPAEKRSDKAVFASTISPC